MNAALDLVPTPMALRCPKCAAEMVTFERSGIPLEQCRECRGIYLDRGELERLVDAESGGAGWAGPLMNPPAPIPLPLATDPRTLARPMDARGYRAEWSADDDAHARRAQDNNRSRDDGGSQPPSRRSFIGD